MRNVFVSLIILSLILLWGCLYADSVGKGTSGDNDTDDDTSNCEDNHPPELLNIYYFLKVEDDWTPLEPPITIASADFKNLYIRLEYSDEDCNLEGGEFWLKFEDGDWESVEELPNDIGCSTEKTGYLYPLKLKDVVGALSSGNYQGEVKWTDVCDDESNTLDFEFTLY